MREYHGKKRKRRSGRSSGLLVAAMIILSLLLFCGGIFFIYRIVTKDREPAAGSGTTKEVPISDAAASEETAVVEIPENNAGAGAGLPVKTAGAMTGLNESSEIKPGAGATGPQTPETVELPVPDGAVTGALLSDAQNHDSLSGETASPEDPAQPAEGTPEGGEEGQADQPGGETPAPAAQTEPAYTPEEEAAIAAYYSNTVLAGDSVMLGFRNYCRSGDAVLQGINFLVAGSYSLHNAFWPVGGDSVHPLYQGQQRPLWESIQMIGPNRVFLFFGINDLVYGIEDTVAKYHEMVDKIKSVTPDVQIVIISTTYTLAGKGGKNLNNANIAKFNQIMAGEAAANGWGFVDIATPTSDGNGNLLPAYCSDGYLHQSHAAYDVWKKTLKEYALAQSGLR